MGVMEDFFYKRGTGLRPGTLLVSSEKLMVVGEEALSMVENHWWWAGWRSQWSSQRFRLIFRIRNGGPYWVTGQGEPAYII